MNTESFNHQQYRKNLSDGIIKEKDKQKRRTILRSAKETIEYQKAEELHRVDIASKKQHRIANDFRADHEASTEPQEAKSPEYILYHNAIHLELREGEPIDFFAEKSDATKNINDAFEQTARQLPEVQTLIASDKFLEVKRLLLDSEDVLYVDNRRDTVVNQLHALLKDESLPEIQKMLTSAGSGITRLRSLMNDQLSKKNIPIDPQKLRALKAIRDRGYFLTKEDESFRGWSLVAFDMRTLLHYGFTIYEANNEAADSIAHGVSSIYCVREYFDSFKEIHSSEDCLQYSHDYEEDYDAARITTVYKPYCPEYIVQPPSSEWIADFMQKQYDDKDKQLVAKNMKAGEDIDINNLNPHNHEDYRFIVNILFNAGIIDIQTAKARREN